MGYILSSVAQSCPTLCDPFSEYSKIKSSPNLPFFVLISLPGSALQALILQNVL